jgi:cell division protein FtsB
MIRFIKGMIKQCVDLFFLLVGGYLCYQIMIAPGGIRLYKQLAMLKSEEGRKLASTQQQILGLQHKTQLLQEDKQYQAYEARVVWELVKPGEQVVWYRDLEDE